MALNHRRHTNTIKLTVLSFKQNKKSDKNHNKTTSNLDTGLVAIHVRIDVQCKQLFLIAFSKELFRDASRPSKQQTNQKQKHKQIKSNKLRTKSMRDPTVCQRCSYRRCAPDSTSAPKNSAPSSAIFFFFFSKQQKQLVSFKPARRVCSAKRNARSYQCSKCTQSPTSETANSCNEKREEKKKEQRQRKITFHEEGRRKSYCRDVQAAQMFAHSESSPTRSCHCIAAPTILKSLKKTKQKNKNKETLSEVAIRNWFVFAGCPMS